MSRFLKSPQARRVGEMTLYIRASRTFHKCRRRPAAERHHAAVMMAMWREACWQSWRQAYDSNTHLSVGSPWGWYSIRTGLRYA